MQIFSKKNKFSLAVFILIAICLIFFNFISFPINILSWDVFGYYIYLPMIFIYNNWGLQDINILNHIIEQYNNSPTLYQAYQTETGFWVMRYSMGMAVLYSPFFFIAHLISGFTNFPQDGFSFPYQTAIFIGGVFYSVIGFYFLRKILLRYFTDIVAAACLAILYFGTNYFFHTSLHATNAMSHNYLFTLYVLIIWLTINWHVTFGIKYLIPLAIICGISILARPSEIVCLFIPFLWHIGVKYSLTEKIKLFFKLKQQFLLFFFILFVIALPQFVYWKIISGKFFFDSYGNNAGEGFEFLHPFISEVLFSFRKGWLIYTPVMIFALIGIYFSLKSKKEFSIPVLTLFIINLYIVSSWTCWWYAESFGQRSLIPSYALLVLPLGFFLENLFFMQKKIRNVVMIFIGCLIVLNLFQTWQISNGIIHLSRMTKDAYFAVFAKTTIPSDFEKMLLLNRDDENAAADINESEYSKTIEWLADLGKNQTGFQLDSEIIYSPSIEKTYSEITLKDHAKLKASMKIFCTTDIKNNPGSMIITFEHKGRAYGYKGIDLEKMNIKINEWTEISANYLTPVTRKSNDKLKVYYWHRGKQPVLIKDLKVEVWEKKD